MSHVAEPTDGLRSAASPPAVPPPVNVEAGLLPYRVTIEPTLDDGAALALWRDAEPASVFNHPAWWRAAIDAFGQRRRLYVINIYHGATLVGLWPLWRKRLGAREGFARVIEPVGARVTDYCVPLMRVGQQRLPLFAAMLEAMAGTLDAQTFLLLPKLPVAELPLDILEHAALDRGLSLASQARPCPGLALPATYAELEQRWRTSHRSLVRRRIKRLRSAGTLELVTAGTRPDVLEMLPRLMTMHIANWRARSGYSDLEIGPMPKFLRALAQTLPLSAIEASEVRLDGIAIASHFGFRDRGSLLWYKPTFDIAWSTYAPGNVHVALAAARSIGQGMATFDFMQGEEPYKQNWSDLTTLTKSFALATPMAYPIWAWNARVRRFAAEYRI